MGINILIDFFFYKALNVKLGFILISTFMCKNG